MVIQKGRNVDIGHPIAIGEAEHVVAQVLTYSGQTPSGEGGVSGVDKSDLPGFSLPAVNFHVPIRHVKGDITGVQEVVGEVFLDHIALVAAANDEIGDAVVAVAIHGAIIAIIRLI